MVGAPTFADLRFGKPHQVARTQVHASLVGSVERGSVPANRVSWGQAFPDYRPAEVDRPEKGWTPDPRDPRDVQRPFESLEGAVETSPEGRPLNPAGRTGISGRGVLSAWGASQAADLVLTRHSPDNGNLEVLLVQRGDASEAAQARQEWALVGGWRDELENGEPESAADAAKREAAEETGLAGVDIDMSRAEQVFAGYVDDPRNTDNAWMETTAFHYHLSPEEAQAVAVASGPQQGDRAAGEAPEIRATQWVKVDQYLPMYASHGDILRTATAHLPTRVEPANGGLQSEQAAGAAKSMGARETPAVDQRKKSTGLQV